MKRYSSNLIMRLPLMIPAIITALISFVMFYVTFAETALQIPSFVEKFCIFVMAAFLAWVTYTLIRIGFKDFYLEIIPGENQLQFRQITKSFSLRWQDIKLVHESASTLSLTTFDGKMLSLSADLSYYDDLKEIIISKTAKKNPFKVGES